MSEFENIVRAYEIEKEKTQGASERSLFYRPFVSLSDEQVTAIEERVKVHTKDGSLKIERWSSVAVGLLAAFAGSLPGIAGVELIETVVKLAPEISREAGIATAAIAGTWAYIKHRQSAIDGWIAARHMVATGRRPFEERDILTKAEANKIRVRAGFAPTNG